MTPLERLRRTLNRIRPSYLILLSAAPFVVYLFASEALYGRALSFIAPGIAVSVAATVLAYLAAVVLGLLLAGLLVLRLGKRTLPTFFALVLALAALSTFFFTRPKATYLLVGEPEGRVAILSSTPERLSGTIQAGGYAEGAPERDIRSASSVEAALEDLDEGDVTALFVPAREAPAGADVLWEVSFLPDSARRPALALAFFALLTLLLTVGAWSNAQHPLAIFAELYVDMIRGIPMLVIILYVGFPLQGAIRDATGGLIDMPRLARGVVAIALGYAAYMAEIFRAGIQAIPKGQLEASRSLGLSGPQTARFVILPQALRIVTPPLGNEFVAMLKDTSLLSLLSIRDITQRTREFAAETFEYFPAFNTVALLYIALTLAASSLVKFAERRTKYES